jgi:hypothetical protein
MMQYAFLQYHHWRDRLHQWFGLCIVKAGSCTDPDQKSAIMSLADHTFTDLQDGHSEMYSNRHISKDVTIRKPSTADLAQCPRLTIMTCAAK